MVRSFGPTAAESEGAGRALRRDLETMFQLIYLTFTQPRADPEAFRAATGQLTAALANRQALPDAAFEDTLNAAVTQNHLRARPMTQELVSQMNLDKSLAFYKDRFADASDFTVNPGPPPATSDSSCWRNRGSSGHARSTNALRSSGGSPSAATSNASRRSYASGIIGFAL